MNVMRFLIMGLMAISLLMGATAPATAGEQWQGTDVVVEKILQEYGAQPRDPLINTDQGDLILFVFALGGFAAGLLVGYHGRRLFVEREGLKPQP